MSLWFRDLNATNAVFQQYGITLRNFAGRFWFRAKKLAWSIGLVFTFKMQPTDEKEATYAHSQRIGVSDESFELCSLRVIEERRSLFWHLVEAAENVGRSTTPGRRSWDGSGIALDDDDDDGLARTLRKPERSQPYRISWELTNAVLLRL